MKISLSKLSSVGTLAFLVAAPLAAQNVNNSNVISQQVTTATVTGIYTASGSTAGAPPIAVTSSVTTSMTNALTAAGGLTSAIAPGVTVSPQIGGALVSLLSGTGGGVGGGAATIQGDLNSGGAPASEAAALVVALNGLVDGNGNVNLPALSNAIDKFNAMINAAGPAFLTNPPPSMVAIHTALTTLSAAARGV